MSFENHLLIRSFITCFLLGITGTLYYLFPFKALQMIRRHYKKIILIFFLIYLADTASRFFDTCCFDSPIIQDDYAFHFVDAVESASYFKAHHRIWGYNPYYLAGYPSGIFLAIDNHWALLFMLLLGGLLSPAFVFNLSIFFFFLILPLLVFLTAKNFKMGNTGSLFFFVLSIFMTSGFPTARSYIGNGSYAFILATYLSFYILSLLFKYLNQKNLRNLAVLTIIGSLAFLVHPLSSVISSVLCIPFLLVYLNKIKFKDIYRLIISALIIFSANLPWIRPWKKFSYLLLPHGWAVYHETYPRLILDTLLKDWAFTVLLAFFLFFLWKSYKSRNHRFAVSISISYLIFFIFSFFGTQIGLSDIQPDRFIIPLALISLFSISRITESQMINRNAPFLILSALCLILFLSYPPDKFVCGYKKTPEAEEILDFIKTNIPGTARLHVEDSEKHPYFLSHFTAMIPHLTSKEILAGPFISPPTKFQFTQYVDDRLFGRNLDDLSYDELDKYLELYNVKYFLVFSERAYIFFDRNQKFRRIFKSGRYSIYEYSDSDESFCYKSRADVEATYDKILVRNASSDVTILKYHYINTLRIIPVTLPFRPIKLLDDPVPFILVKNGDYRNFLIYNK
jgi:hypothetical protein